MILEFIEKISTKYDNIISSANSIRSNSISHTLKKVLKIKNKIGVTRLNFLSELDNINLPVVSVTRPNITKYQMNTSTQGKGFTIREALVSALMESVEHHAANTFQYIYSESCENLLKTNQLFLHPKNLQGTCQNTQQIDWIKSINIINNNVVYLPAGAILFPYIPSLNSVIPNFPVLPSTTGLASGNTILEASLSAILELIERDALSRFVNGENFCYIDHKKIQNSKIQSIIKKLKNSEMEFCILLIKSQTKLPVIFTSIISKNPILPPITVSGHTCRINVNSAIIHSLLEAIQVHAAVIQSSREDLLRHDKKWKNKKSDVIKEWQEAKKFIIKNSVKFDYKDFIKNSTLKAKTYFILDQLIQSNYNEIYVTDITNNEINIPVVRVTIPRMLDQAHNPNFKKKNLIYLRDSFFGI